MKDDRRWIPDAVDLDWIESLAAPLPPAPAAIEAAAEPPGIPIVDRDTGRVLAALAAGRRRIVEVGTAYGYSTLWLALGQPADGTIVTIDPDSRADRPRARLVARGRHRRRADHAGQRPGARRVRGRRPARSPGRSTSSSSTRSSPSTTAYLDALIAAGGSRRRRPRRRRQRPVERPRLRLAAGRRRRREHDRPSARSTQRSLADPRFTATILPLGDGLLVAALARRPPGRCDPGPAVRHPARAGRHARGRRSTWPTAADGRRRLGRRSSRGHPVLAPGRGSRSASRATATTPTRRRPSPTATRWR